MVGTVGDGLGPHDHTEQTGQNLVTPIDVVSYRSFAEDQVVEVATDVEPMAKRASISGSHTQVSSQSLLHRQVHLVDIWYAEIESRALDGCGAELVKRKIGIVRCRPADWLIVPGWLNC